MSEVERSASRGRDKNVWESTGRGGAGNIRISSASRDAARQSGALDDSVRGREYTTLDPNVTHVGRGGAGNVRSPSRDTKLRKEAAEAYAKEQREILQKRESEDLYHSSGRGGAGNIERSRSRSRDPAAAAQPGPALHPSGRGGYGNYSMDHPDALAALEEEREGREKRVEGGYHSSGRGGAGNITDAQDPVPDLERNAAPIYDTNAYRSTGRGGAGNLYHNK